MFQQAVKNFSINFNALNDRNTVSSGDLLAGQVSFDLTKTTKISSIATTLTGRAHIHWSTGGGGGRRGRRRRRVHSAKVDFFNCGGVILQEHATDGTTKLQPGSHVYPFTCYLPQGDFPSAFRGAHGVIEYKLTVSIRRPWHLSKDFVTELNFINRIDTNRPELQSPLSGSHQMAVCSLWCASRTITMTASVEKKAFVPGETVKIICKFSNFTARTATPKAKLQQKQDYTSNSGTKLHIVKQLVSVTGQRISPETTDVHTEMPLTIPSFAALTISNCSILVVDYVIEVSFGVTFSPDITVLIPIILCDTPVVSCPPPY